MSPAIFPSLKKSRQVMSEVIREFLVQGSEPSPYKVAFKKNGPDLTATCSCREGVNRLLSNTVSRFSMATMGLL